MYIVSVRILCIINFWKLIKLKYKYIISVFTVAAPICVILRAMQLLYTTNETTGFVTTGYSTQNSVMMTVLLALALTVFISGFFVRRAPGKLPEASAPLGTVSMIFAAGIIYETVFTQFALRIPQWQIIIVKVLGALSALFLVLFALSCFAKFKLSSLLFVFPVLYGAAKLLLTFAEISAIALISDNFFAVVTQCALLLFLLQLSKISNGIFGGHTRSIFLASGLCAALLCFVMSLPPILIKLLRPGRTLHTGIPHAVFYLCSGIFCLVFLLVFFNIKNLESKKYSSHGKKRLGTAESGDGAGISYFCVPSDESAQNKSEEESKPEKNDVPDSENDGDGFTVIGFDSVDLSDSDLKNDNF